MTSSRLDDVHTLLCYVGPSTVTVFYCDCRRVHGRTLWLADVVATDVRQKYFIDSNTINYPVETVKDCEITTTPTTNRLQTPSKIPCHLYHVPACIEHACTQHTARQIPFFANLARRTQSRMQKLSFGVSSHDELSHLYSKDKTEISYFVPLNQPKGQKLLTLSATFFFT